ATREALGDEPEKVFDALADPVRTRTPSRSKQDATAVCAQLEQLFKLIGRPDDETAGSLHAALTARAQALAKEAEGQLAFMAVTFIEQPQYRLAGAEEAVRQI